MSSYLGGGLASLDRWEGLKEWHRRHQDLLDEKSMDMKSEGTEKQFQYLMNAVESENSSLHPEESSQKEEILLLTSAVPKHDLSIIPEADEDSRSKDGDMDCVKPRVIKNVVESKKLISTTCSEENKHASNKPVPNEVRCAKPNGMLMNSKQDSLAEKRVVKRPFLRKGQGLVKYNLHPEDLKHPYRKTSASAKKDTSVEKRNYNRTNKFSMRHQESKKPQGQPSEKQHQSIKKHIKTTELVTPIQRLVLPIPPQKSSAPEIGTWSQVLAGGLVSSVTNFPNSDREPCWQNIQKEETFKPKTLSNEVQKTTGFSPRRRIDPQNKAISTSEEDQESLAAYLDLEQHVGNASFCSTSSKVDRLVAKSSQLSIHQSNPDAITQLKQLTPVKTGRKFFNPTEGENNIPKDYQSMSATDLENLVKARARRSGSLVKVDEVTAAKKSQEFMIKIPPSEPQSAHPEPQAIDWMLEAFGPVRKPHLMKTAPNIDLDSSLIKNALVSKYHGEDPSFDSELDSSESSSESSSEGDFEVDLLSGTDGNSKSVQSKSPKDHDNPRISKENQKVAPVTLKLVDDASFDEINNQIETHLSDLRKEIETLQAAKGKTQSYISSMEKKIQELEHRLALDTRSFNKQLEEEREASAKRLSEEQAKFAKEKQALQRTLREERRKAPDPVTQQDLLRLRQEITQWEEKWRTDRAKARGLESNLRIQITNFKRENDKLKEENIKLQREKEAALSTAKARASSNTRVINSIAQQLGSTKPKVFSVREEKTKLKKKMVNSAYDLRSQPKKQPSNLKPVPVIGNFPELPQMTKEWSSDEEIDLGKETSDEDDSGDFENVPPTTTSCSALKSDRYISQAQEGGTAMQDDQQEIFDLEATQAKYDAIFGKTDIEPDPLIAGFRRLANEEISNAVNPTSCKEHEVPDSANPGLEKYIKSIQHPDGEVEQIKENGTRVITYPDGTWKRHSSSGSIITVPPSGWPVHISYFNGDQLEKLQDGTTRYFYAKTNVWQTTFPDGQEELRYSSGQVECRKKDGSVKVLLAGVKNASSEKQSGTSGGPQHDEISVEKLPNGDTMILLPNGERELHTEEYMKKDFLDGTVKFLYKDGSQETRYPSGRIRIKDAHGNLIKDTVLTT